MVKFALIGGRTNSDISVNEIEKYILTLTNCKIPNVLFCPYASNDYIKSNKKFKSLLSGLNVNLKLMDESNYLEFDSLLSWADILYIGGGCVNDLVNIFTMYNYYSILQKYILTNKIYAGISAGAMIYTKKSMGDRDVYIDKYHKYNYKMVNCLGLVNISVCPHYQEEDLIVYNDEIKYLDYISFGIENDTALIIDDNRYYVFKENKSRSVYYFSLDKLMVPLYEGVVYEENSSIRTKGNI